MALFAKKTWLREKSRVFALRIMGFPQELKTVRFNLEPKRCKSVSLSAKRSVFTLARARSSNRETAFSVKFPGGPGEDTENHTHLSRLPPAAGGTPQDLRACDSDRRVTVNNIQFILVCGRPSDRAGVSVPRHKVHARYCACV